MFGPFEELVRRFVLRLGSGGFLLFDQDVARMHIAKKNTSALF